MAKKQSHPEPVRREIPDSDFVARFCAPVNLDANGRPTGAAFQTRPQDQGRLSCAWVECLSGPPAAAQAAAVRANLWPRVAGYDTNGRIGLLNAGEVRALVADSQRLDVAHWPNVKNPCHSAVAGVGGVLELTFAELLADLAAANTIPA